MPRGMGSYHPYKNGSERGLNVVNLLVMISSLRSHKIFGTLNEYYHLEMKSVVQRAVNAE